MTYDELYRARLRPMLVLATMMVHSAADAEDLVQDAFIKVHERWADIEEPPAFLRQVVVRNCYRHTRDRSRRENRAKLMVPKPEDGPVGALELLDVIDALPLAQRQAIVAYYYGGMSVGEIAEAFGRSANTVKSDLMRARKRLKQQLLEDDQ